MSKSQPVPVPDADSKAEPEQARDQQTRSGRPVARVSLVLSLLALGLSIGLSAVAYFSWHELQQLVGAQAGAESRVENRIEPLRSSLNSVGRTVRDEQQQIDRQLKQLAEEQQSVGDRVSVLAALVGRSEQGWSLAEVEYLLRIANQRLQLQRDLKTAQLALQAADTRLQELADPLFLKVREQLASELESLAAVEPVDVDGISVKLSALMEHIDELEVQGSSYQPAVKTDTAGSGNITTIQDWRELPALLWSSLSGLFRIRDHDKPVSPMLPPENEYFLRENLRLQLSATRLALLRDDSVQYRATLTTAAGWLDTYFSAEDAQVDQLRAQIEQLAAIDVVPKLPDISASLKLLRQQLKLGAQQAVLPDVPDSTSDVPAGETEKSLSGTDAEAAS